MSGICRGRVVTTGEAVEVAFDGALTAVEPILGGPLPDHYVAPAFLDLQVNGFAGVDYCSAGSTLEEIAASIRQIHATGVARFYPTVITGGRDEMMAALRNLARAKEELPEGAAFEAFHVEGPYISPEDGPRGAHPRHRVRPPDFDEFRRFQDAARGHIRLLTLSPEWPEAPSFIERIVREGVVAAIGHTQATSAQIQDAVCAGATVSTHLGNGAHAVLARHPNYIWEQMAEDRLTATFIVDGIHLDAAFLKTALRAKGIERSVLITDAVMCAGMPPGPYRLGEVEVELRANQSVWLRDGSKLAGAALTMDRAVSNLMRLTGASLTEAVTMATTNAARAGRVPNRLRGLQPGERADLVEFTLTDGAIQV
ncbi:MAG: amidohydrolase family protein [Bryobacter sp.]|nr:amidohydrolase family protein [Bryobacter sp.]